MAKTYIDTIKYLIYAELEMEGAADKPDVVGAIFGQTEGLLGDDLDLRNLQKNGRIGRIEVDLQSKAGKTIGTINIPSSLDMVETSIVAASLETIDRVGPYDAHIKIKKIEDTRHQKRTALVERAKTLLKTILHTEIPESKELSDFVREEVKTAEIVEYGAEKLPAGPNIAQQNELIFVEGRADVINLLKTNITNIVAIGGAKVPKTLIELSKGKEITVFLDGDRGGDLILNELIQHEVEIDFVARAPVGREVEELTRKEIIKALRAKVPFEQTEEQKNKVSAYTSTFSLKNSHLPIQKKEYEKSGKESPLKQTSVAPTEQLIRNVVKSATEPAPAKKIEKLKKEISSKTTKDNTEFLAELNELTNTLKARLYTEKGVLFSEIPVRDMLKTIEEKDGIETIIFDGIITQRLVEVATAKGIKNLVGIRMGNVSKKPEEIEIIVKNK